MYSMALTNLSNGKKFGIENAKNIFQFTKNDFENNIRFIEVLQDYFNCNITDVEAENILFDNLILEIKSNGISDWSNIGAFLGSENVFKVFNHLQDELTDKDYWIVLGKCYVMSSFSHSNYNLIKKFFQSVRSNKSFIMSEEERLELDSLPDEIEIYRGCSKQEIKSGDYRFSWTTKKATAEFFAKRNKVIFGVPNSVVSKTIMKTEAFAYFNRREENEIIYFQ